MENNPTNMIKRDDASTERLWRIMENTLNEATREQRRKRRWGIFFKILIFLYITFVLLMIVAPKLVGDDMKFVDSEGQYQESVTAVIELKGMIAADEPASADRLVTSLRRAFKNERVKGIVIRINSGGGSPVQSGYVYDEIKRLRAIYPDKKVYSVITDIGASGAYYIAAASDEIYADKASLVGSIGVTGASFGFVDTLDKLGVERRVYTSGEHKAFLDPFQPMRDDETEFWQGVLGHVHEQFIDIVKEGRGDRLKWRENPDLFSGLLWTGEQALDLGLIDGLGSTSYVARDVIGAEHTVDFTVQDDPLKKLMRTLGATVSNEIKTGLQTFELR